MITFLLLIACDSPAQDAPQVAAPKTEHATATGTRKDVSIDDLEKALASKALVVDVRTDPEWKNGHVPGAVHIPMGDVAAHPLIKKHDKSTPIYFICQSGGRSGRTADLMAAQGYQTLNVTGGTGAWAKAGKPITK